MDEKVMDILQRSAEVFMRFGIKSVTMDDVARELKVSKKTLYKYVKDKKDLVKKVMEGDCAMEEAKISEIVSNAENAIDEIVEITKHVAGKLKEVHPSIHFDLEKYYGEAWEVFHNHKKEFIYTCVLQNLKRGIKEGYYRKNLQPEIIAKIYASKIDLVFDGQLFPVTKYRFDEVYAEMMRYHLRGVASEKGIDYTTQKMKKEKLNFF